MSPARAGAKRKDCGGPRPGVLTWPFSTRLLTAHTQNAWSISPDAGSDPVSCEVRGDDSAVALFVMGRIGAGHPGIVVTDDPVARTFKRYFPGP